VARHKAQQAYIAADYALGSSLAQADRALIGQWFDRGATLAKDLAEKAQEYAVGIAAKLEDYGSALGAPFVSLVGARTDSGKSSAYRQFRHSRKTPSFNDVSRTSSFASVGGTRLFADTKSAERLTATTQSTYARSRSVYQKTRGAISRTARFSRFKRLETPVPRQSAWETTSDKTVAATKSRAVDCGRFVGRKNSLQRPPWSVRFDARGMSMTTNAK
jgi:hypothetical protein